VRNATENSCSLFGRDLNLLLEKEDSHKLSVGLRKFTSVAELFYTPYESQFNLFILISKG